MSYFKDSIEEIKKLTSMLKDAENQADEVISKIWESMASIELSEIDDIFHQLIHQNVTFNDLSEKGKTHVLLMCATSFCNRIISLIKEDIRVNSGKIYRNQVRSTNEYLEHLQSIKKYVSDKRDKGYELKLD